MPSVGDKLGLGPTRTETRLPDGCYAIVVVPPKWTGFHGATIKLTPLQYEGYIRWMHGDLYLHEAIPSLTPEQREILMTGITPSEWNATFKDDP